MVPPAHPDGRRTAPAERAGGPADHPPASPPRPARAGRGPRRAHRRGGPADPLPRGLDHRHDRLRRADRPAGPPGRPDRPVTDGPGGRNPRCGRLQPARRPPRPRRGPRGPGAAVPLRRPPPGARRAPGPARRRPGPARAAPPLSGRHDPPDLRAPPVHREAGRPGRSAARQPAALSRLPGPVRLLARQDRAGAARARACPPHRRPPRALRSASPASSAPHRHALVSLGAPALAIPADRRPAVPSLRLADEDPRLPHRPARRRSRPRRARATQPGADRLARSLAAPAGVLPGPSRPTACPRRVRSGRSGQNGWGAAA